MISLNLANNELDEKCGQLLREKLETNFTLIDLDFSDNNFTMNDSRQIQEYLKRNKALYDAERLREWKERKQMNIDDQQLREMRLDESARQQRAIMDEEARDIAELELNAKWKKYMNENEIEKQALIQQLLEASEMRKKMAKKPRRRPN